MTAKIIFRYHAIQRMFQREISELAVTEIIKSGKVLQDYLDDQPYPSCLKLGFFLNRPIHVIIANNTTDNEIIVVTAYEPELDKWEAGFEKRRRDK
jgi:hypothetical protein